MPKTNETQQEQQPDLLTKTLDQAQVLTRTGQKLRPKAVTTVLYQIPYVLPPTTNERTMLACDLNRRRYLYRPAVLQLCDLKEMPKKFNTDVAYRTPVIITKEMMGAVGLGADSMSPGKIHCFIRAEEARVLLGTYYKKLGVTSAIINTLCGTPGDTALDAKDREFLGSRTSGRVHPDTQLQGAPQVNADDLLTVLNVGSHTIGNRTEWMLAFKAGVIRVTRCFNDDKYWVCFEDVATFMGFDPEEALGTLACFKDTGKDALVEIRNFEDPISTSSMTCLSAISIARWLAVTPWQKYTDVIKVKAESLSQRLAVVIAQAVSGAKPVPVADAPQWQEKPELVADPVKLAEIKAIVTETSDDIHMSEARIEDPVLNVNKEPSEKPKAEAPKSKVRSHKATEELDIDSLTLSCEYIPATFNGVEYKVVTMENRQYVLLSQLCKALGIRSYDQRKKVQNDPKYTTLDIQCTDARGLMRNTLAIDLDCTHAWLFSLNANKVKPESRADLLLYQKEMVKVIRDYCVKGVAINPRLVSAEDYERLEKMAADMLVAAEKALEAKDAQLAATVTDLESTKVVLGNCISDMQKYVGEVNTYAAEVKPMLRLVGEFMTSTNTLNTTDLGMQLEPPLVYTPQEVHKEMIAIGLLRRTGMPGATDQNYAITAKYKDAELTDSIMIDIQRNSHPDIIKPQLRWRICKLDDIRKIWKEGRAKLHADANTAAAPEARPAITAPEAPRIPDPLRALRPLSSYAQAGRTINEYFSKK